MKVPYIGIALALIVAGARDRDVQPAQDRDYSGVPAHGGRSITAARDLWKQRQLVLGALGIFLYVGAEVSIGSFLINYFTQPEIGNMTVKAAAGLVSLYWLGAMIGRFIGCGAGCRSCPRGRCWARLRWWPASWW